MSTVVTNTQPERPLTHLYVWSYRLDRMDTFQLRETIQGFLKYLNENSLNYVYYMPAGFLYLFTEGEIDLDPIMVKMLTNVTLIGDKNFDVGEFIRQNVFESGTYFSDYGYNFHEKLKKLANR
jgi:hypothetical protein